MILYAIKTAPNPFIKSPIRKGTTPIDCPTWAIVSVDHLGREKRPCCIGSAEKDSMKPRCEECGLGCYSIFVGSGIKGC